MGNAATQLSDTENVTWFLLQMLYAFHQWKNFENRWTFDEVKADYT